MVSLSSHFCSEPKKDRILQVICFSSSQIPRVRTVTPPSDAVRRRHPHRRTRSPHSSTVPIITAVLFHQPPSWPYVRAGRSPFLGEFIVFPLTPCIYLSHPQIDVHRSSPSARSPAFLSIYLASSSWDPNNTSILMNSRFLVRNDH